MNTSVPRVQLWMPAVVTFSGTLAMHIFVPALAMAGLAAALAPDAHALIAARLVQARGGCAGLVLARVIVRDTATDNLAAKHLAQSRPGDRQVAY